MVADYYEMLGVAPDADRVAIESALARRQPEWSSKTRHPSKGTTFQSYLDQIPEIRRRLLGDPAERAAYDAERTAASRAELAARLDHLQRLVALRAAKGGLTVSDRKILLDEATRLGLGKPDLDRLAAPFPPLPEAPVEPAEQDEVEEPADVIEPATRRQIRIALDHLHKRDLYDLLDLDRDAPIAEIASCAAAERRKWMQKAQVTAEKTAWLNAVSLAQSHLANPQARARYDRTLGLEAEEAFGETAGFVLRGLVRLDPGTRDALVHEAASVGIRPERAAKLIRRACRALGIDPEPKGPAPANDLAGRRWIRCRSCLGLTEYTWSEIHGSGECRHCRASLRWDCPACRRRAWVDEPRCSHCKFPLEHLEPLVRHFEAAQHAHKARRLEEALAHLRRVQDFAPHHVGARKGIEKVGQQLAQVRKLRGIFQTEMARRKLVAARAAVEAWSRLVEPDDPDVAAALREVQDGMTKAGALAAKGRQHLADDPLRARQWLRQALALAADLPEIHEALRLCPPDGPTDLKAAFDGGKVILRWSAPRPDGLGPVRYRILRKRQSRPEHAEDGRVVADVDAAEWTDTSPQPGESFGYAVFATRHGVSSPSGVSAGPFLAADDVRDVRIEARSGEVRLSWTPPEGILGVRVVRKPGAPVEGPRDGLPIEATEDGALDRGLDDGRVYHYGIFALYRGPDRRPHPSRGVFVSAVPQPPALPVNDLTIAADPDGRLRLGWTAPTIGHVRIARTPAPFPIPAGDRRSAAEVERADPTAAWLDEVAPDHAFDERRESAGIDHFTPITFAAGLATVGRSLTYSHVADPTDLRVARAPGSEAVRVLLRWRWNPQAAQTLVVARRGADPTGPDDPEALVFTVREDEYARLRHFAVDLPQGRDAPWHLAVFSVARLNGQRHVSPGLEPTARAVVPGPEAQVTIWYKLRLPIFPGARGSVTLHTDPPGSPVPPMVLVAHTRTIPLSPEDGAVVARFPASRDGERLSFRSAPRLASPCLRLFPDPSANPDGIPPIRIRHPESGTTRV
jgi:hypothetical protein